MLQQALLSSCTILALHGVMVDRAFAQTITASGDVTPFPSPNPQPGPWAAGGSLFVGDTGIGTLRIENGGEVSNYLGIIGDQPGSTGEVSVAGPGSTWISNGALIVGQNGSGRLLIMGGGQVSTPGGYIGAQANSTGEVMVTGAGSVFSFSTGDLFLGVGGSGTLTVEAGGMARAPITQILSGGTLNIYGTEGARGALETGKIIGAPNTERLNLDGGILRARIDEADFLVNFSNGLIIGSGGLFFDTQIHQVGIVSDLSGGGGVTKQGTGTLTLSGANTYTGGTTISAGTLQIGNGSNTGSIVGNVVNNGTLAFDRSDDLIFGGSISGSGGLIKRGDGVLTLTASNFYTGATVVLEGTLRTGGTGFSSSSAFQVEAGASLDMNLATNRLGSLSGAGLVTSSRSGNHILSVGDNGSSTTFSGTIDDGAGRVFLRKEGAGTLTLSGTNTYSGTTIVEAGTLRAAADGSFSADTDMTVDAGATLALSDNIFSSLRSLAGAGDVQIGQDASLSISGGSSVATTFSGNITGGAGSFLSVDDGALTLTGTSTIDHLDICDCGSLTLSGSTASLTVVGYGIEAGGTFNVLAGAYVHASGMNVYGDTTISGGSQVELEDGILVEGFVPRLFIRDGGLLLVHGFAAIEGQLPGMLPGALVTGENSRWTVEQDFFLGNFNFGGPGTLQVADKGAVEVQGDLHIGALTGFDASLATVSDAGSTLAVDRTIFVGEEDCGCGPTIGMLTAETGGTVAAGRIEIGSLGTLNIGTGGTAGSIDTSSIINAGSIVANHTGTASLGAALSGDGSFTKRGIGVLTFTGDGTAYTGSTGIEAGTLLVGSGGVGVLGGPITVGASGTLGGSGTILGTTQVNGMLAAGNSPGTLTFAGDLTLGVTSTTVFELGTPGVAGGATNDFISVSGLLSLNGTLEAGVAGAGYYRLFDAGSVSGTFASSAVTGIGGFSVAAAAVQYNIAGQVNLSVLGAGQNLQFWDGSNMAGNGTVDGGTGTWNVANTNWTGTPGDALANNAWAGSVGMFMSAPGTVTVASTQSFDTLQFATDGYQLVGGTLAMNPASGSFGTISTDSGVNTTFASVVADGAGSSGLLKIGGGTLILSATNTYTGGTAINGGTLQVAADTSLGGAAGGLTLNGGALATTASFDTARSVTLTGAGAFNVGLATTLGLSGTVAGPGGLVKQGFGTLTLNGTSSYTGGTTIQAGTLQVGNGGTSGSIMGNVVNNGALAFNRSDDVVFAGSIAGTGYVTKQGAGSLTLTGMSSYSGSTLVNAGTLVLGNSSAAGTGPIALANDTTLAFVDSLNVANAVLVFNDATLSLASGAATLAGPLSGFGSVSFAGDGVLTLTGNSSSFIGTSSVSGTLAVNGTLGGTVNVLTGGLLKGTGIVGSLNLASGAVVAPGNSIGTLSVSGDVSVASGSNYEVEISGNGTSDRIAASGQAILNGGTVEVVALDPQVNYQNGQRYTILTATGGITGAFDQAVADSIFLTVDLEQQANSIDLTIAVQGDGPTPPAVFTSAAATPNQFAVASALGTLPQSGPELGLYNALLFLNSEAEARVAFDQLSGEAYASAKGMFIEQSALLRTAMIDRLRASFGAVAASSAPVMAYAAPSGPAAGEAGMALKAMVAPAVTEKFALWTSGFGSWGEMDGNGNAASLSSSNGGFLIGADATLGAGWRLGITGGYSYTNFDVDSRNSSGDSENWHIGLYGGNQWGPLGLRTGLAYTFHDVEMSRAVGFTGFGDALSADYDAGTFQAFGELGYRIDTAFAAFEPFANLAYVSLHTDGFTENGGAAALTGTSSTTDTSFTTLGLRASKTVLIGDAETTLRGMLGWRHAFGDITPLATQAFTGSDAFTIAGTPIAKDAALIEAGFDVLIGTSTTLGVAYTGQFGDGVTQNGFNATLRVAF